MRLLLFLVALGLGHTVVAATLFDSNEPLAISLQADFKRLEKERDKAASYPGQLLVDNLQLPIELEVRGNFRLNKRNCRFSPLRIDFKQSKARKDSVFAGQDDIKLVVLCKNKNSHRNYLRREFLTYKLLNQLTPLSYQVRWVDVTYKTPNSDRVDTRPGFFVEKKKHVAKRNGLKVSKQKSTRYRELDVEQATLLDHFQYLIGNTDYSLVIGRNRDECCHNAKLLESHEALVPVIYDFDTTGIVNPSYAQISPNIDIDDIQERLYRGYCVDPRYLNGAKTHILENARALIDIINRDAVLSKQNKRRVVAYLEEGFGVFRQPKRYSQKIIQGCR